MKTEKQGKFYVRTHRIFSTEIKKQSVKDIETGKCTVRQLSAELCVSESSIYNWIYRYSRYLKKQKTMVVEDQSESYRSKELEKRIKELEAALGRKQMELDFLNKMIEIADDEFKINIKKKSAKKPSSGSGSTKGKSTNTK
jgi:transposase